MNMETIAAAITVELVIGAVIGAILGAILGGIIGALINWYFAHQSSEELRKIAADLKQETAVLQSQLVVLQQTVNTVATILEDWGATVARDSAGNVVGI